jgi:hypothetical protein
MMRNIKVLPVSHLDNISHIFIAAGLINTEHKYGGYIASVFQPHINDGV